MNPAASTFFPARVKREPSPARGGEGHGRREDPGCAASKNPPAYRERNAERVGLGTGETPLSPQATLVVTDSISGDPVKRIRMFRRGVGWAHSTEDGEDNITSPEERSPALLIRLKKVRVRECR